MEPGTLALLTLAAFFAGFVDSIIGGGGVITLPALLAAGVPPHMALGTNKLAATGASTTATWHYARAGLLVPRLVAWTFPLSVVGTVLGAWLVLQVPGTWIRYLVAGVLVVLVTYVLLRPRFGLEDRFTGLRRGNVAAAMAMALVVGAYDGFLGPGTGNMLLFGWIAIMGFGFLPAAAHGRVLNFGSNVGALAFFAWMGEVAYLTGAVMLIGTVSGAWLGARSSIKHGARWIKPLFVAVALLLLVRLVMQ